MLQNWFCKTILVLDIVCTDMSFSVKPLHYINLQIQDYLKEIRPYD